MVAEINSPQFAPKETNGTKELPGLPLDRVEVTDDDTIEGNDSIKIIKRNDSIPIAVTPGEKSIFTDSISYDKIPDGAVIKSFNPDPNRAVWLSALFPGLGQVYNRRYWKLPIVVGGFMGITYALTWNGRMLSDYTKAYRDATDNDPSTKSYMGFFPTNTKEEDLDITWLQKTLKSRKDFYRRNRDLSIICMVGMYLLCMVDAYVDASLSHFDITPDLSMNVYPSLIDSNSNGIPSVGIQWAINF